MMTARSARSLTKITPLRCLTYGLIASRHLANQKRVRQARDQRSVTQRMRRKLAGIFCFVLLIRAMVPLWLLFFGTWRLANPNKNKILPQVFFLVFLSGMQQPKSWTSQTRKRSIEVGSLGLLLTFFSLKTLKNGVLRTILFRPNNIKISILIIHGCQIG